LATISPKFSSLPKQSNLSLRDQICELISAAITSGSLATDRPLPSCRELADQLNVSRNTVFAAYNRLIDLNLLISRDRSGYFVSPEIAIFSDLQKSKSKNENTENPCPIEFQPNNLMPIVNPLDWQDYPYPFIYNQIDPNLFPVDGWRECSRQVLGRKQLSNWTNDAVESDSSQLVQQLRQRLLNTRGIYADENEILVTLGSQNALFILGSIFSQQPGSVGIEDPGFFGARNAFRMAGLNMIGLPIDEQGLVPTAIPKDCNLVFTTPSHQFPTMVTMSEQRRIELLEEAINKKFIIIEDDYESEMNYVTQTSPSLRSMDTSNRVIYVGSLSKTISPGIRLGFIVAHRDIIREARVVRGVMMRHPPTIVQEIVARFLQLGHYDAHLRNIERRYTERWHAMANAISKHLEMLNQTTTVGGTSFWLTGPRNFDTCILKKSLKERGVLIDRGQDYYLKENDKRSFRLGFAFVPVSKMEAGVKIISEEVKKIL
tara:strand:- start:1475 stop:2938 length:1464 start_codon:yes stop_codon:yes gene_type:complete